MGFSDILFTNSSIDWLEETSNSKSAIFEDFSAKENDGKQSMSIKKLIVNELIDESNKNLISTNN